MSIMSDSPLQNTLTGIPVDSVVPGGVAEGARIFQKAVQQAGRPVLLANEPGSASSGADPIPKRADNHSLARSLTRDQVETFLQQHGLELTGNPRYADLGQNAGGGLLSTVLFANVLNSYGFPGRVVIAAFHPGTTYVTDVAPLAELLRQAADAGAPVARPMEPVDKEPVKSLDGLPALVLPFIKTTGRFISDSHIIAARALAEFHRHSGNADILVDRYQPNSWGQGFAEWAKFELPGKSLDNIDGLRQIIEHNASLYQNPNLPRGLIHGDANKTNFLTTPSGKTDLIDFNLSSNGPFLHDIGTAVLYFSTHRDVNGKVVFDLEKAQEFIEAYSSKRPLTETEEEQLLSFLAMRSSRTLGTYIHFIREHAAEKPADSPSLRAAEAVFAQSFPKQLAYLKFFTMLQALPSMFKTEGSADTQFDAVAIDDLKLKRLIVSSLVAADRKDRAEKKNTSAWTEKLALAIIANPHLTVLDAEKYQAVQHNWTNYYQDIVSQQGKPEFTPLLDSALSSLQSSNAELNIAVDLGAGEGFDARKLLQMSNVGKVIAVDQSPHAEQYFWQEVSDEDKQRLSFINASFADLELPDYQGKVDLVHANASLPYVTTDELPEVIQKVYDMLRPGGVFTANFFMPTHSMAEKRKAGALTVSQIHKLLKDFEVLEVTPRKNEFVNFQSVFPSTYKNHQYFVLARKPLEGSIQQKQQQQQQPNLTDVSSLQVLQQTQQKEQQAQQTQYVEQAQQQQQAQQGSVDSDNAAFIDVLKDTRYVKNGRLTQAWHTAVEQKQQVLAEHNINVPRNSAAIVLAAESVTDSGADSVERFLINGAHQIIRTALFIDLDSFSRQDDFSDQQPWERYKAVYERYRLDLHPMTILDSIQGHRELVTGSFFNSPGALLSSLNKIFVEGDPVTALMSYFFHEPHLLEGYPDNSIDNMDVRSSVTVNMRPGNIMDLSNARQVAAIYFTSAVAGHIKIIKDPSLASINTFLRGGELPKISDFEKWLVDLEHLGLNYTDTDRREFAALHQVYEQVSLQRALARSDRDNSVKIGELTETARNYLQNIVSRRLAGVSPRQLLEQHVFAEAVRRATGADMQQRDASILLLESATYTTLDTLVNRLWGWAENTLMPEPEKVEQIYEQILASNEYYEADFEQAAQLMNFVLAYRRGDISAADFVRRLLTEYLPELESSSMSDQQLTDPDFIKTVIGSMFAKLVAARNADKAALQQSGVEIAGSHENIMPDEATKTTGTSDSLRDQFSDASSNALAEQYQEFAEGNGLFNLTDQQKHPGYTDISLHKKVEHGPGTIGIAPYNLPGLLSEQAGDLTTPVETGIDQSTPTEYTPAQIAPATFNPKSTTPAEPTPEQDRLEQTVRNAYARLPAEVQATLTLEEFRQLDLTEIDLAQQYKAYTSLHRNVTHQDDKPPMRLADYIKFGPEIQQRLQQWSDQAKRSDVEISAYQKQAQIYRGQAAELQQLTQQIQQATAALQAAQSAKPTQSTERITIPPRYPAARMIPEQINKAGNNIINATKTGAPIGEKMNANVPMISLKGKAGLDEYTQSNTIPKYLYKSNQQNQLQLHVVVESGNQLSLQAVPLNVYRPESSIGTHYKPQRGWLNIPQLNAAQQSQINQSIQQATLMIPNPVMAPTIPAGSSAPVPVPQVAP